MDIFNLIFTCNLCTLRTRFYELDIIFLIHMWDSQTRTIFSRQETIYWFAFYLCELTLVFSNIRGSQKNRRRVSRERKAEHRCLHARCITVCVITLTKRRIACYFRCDQLLSAYMRVENISQIFQSRGFTMVAFASTKRKCNNFILAA